MPLVQVTSEGVSRATGVDHDSGNDGDVSALETNEAIEQPVAYASQKPTPTQHTWSTIEREAYTAIWALKRFETWLFGAQITVICDHNPLTYVMECAPKSAKLTRWALALQEFHLVFKYRKGIQHVIPDCLSHRGVT